MSPFSNFDMSVVFLYDTRVDQLLINNWEVEQINRNYSWTAEELKIWTVELELNSWEVEKINSWTRAEQFRNWKDEQFNYSWTVEELKR